MSTIFVDIPSGYVTNGVPYPMGQPTIGFPLKESNVYARVWQQPFIVSGNPVFGAASIVSGVIQTQTGASDAGNGGLFPGSYIVAESDRQALGGDFYSFVRTYAEVPDDHNTYESYAYVFPGYTIGSGSRTSLTKTVVTTVSHEFVYTTDPHSIFLYTGQRFLFYNVDTTQLTAATVPTASTYTGWIAAANEFPTDDSQIVRYFGNIWDRQTRFVKAQ